MKILHSMYESGYEVLAFDPNLEEDLVEDFAPKTEKVLSSDFIEVEEVNWPNFPSGSVFTKLY